MRGRGKGAPRARAISPFAVLAAAVSVLVLAGCAAAGPAGEAAPSGMPTPLPTASAPAVTARPTPTPTPVSGFAARVDELDAGEWVVGYLQPHDLRVGPRTVAYDAGDYISLFGSERERPATVLPPSDPNRDVDGRSFGVQQDADADPMLIMATVERERASGLQAGNTLLVLRTFDGRGESVDQVELAAPFTGNLGSTSLLGTVVVLDAHDEEKDVDVYLALDLESGDVLWSRECDGRYYGHDPVTSQDGTYVIKCGAQYEGVGIRDGVSRWTIAPDGMERGEVMRLPSSGELFSWYSHPAFDVATGATLTPAADQLVFDPVTGWAVSYGDVVYGDPTVRSFEGLRVTDVASGEVVFELSRERAEALGDITLLGAFDQRLWYWGRDGLGVVDMRTGAADPAAPARDGQPPAYRNIPLAAAGTWVLLGRVDPSGSLRVTDLYRDPAGEIQLADLPPTSR